MLLLLQIYNNKFILPQTNPIINTLKYVKCISIWLKAVEVTTKFEKKSFNDTIYTSNIDFTDFNAIWIHLKAFYA